jgi:thiol-disulfide isomerase/thioredoxin
MKSFFHILCICLFSKYSFSQEMRSFPLETYSDPSIYQFSYIQPAKNHLKVILPKISLKQYTLSRSIELKSLAKSIPVLIGLTSSNEKVIIIDENMNNDLTDDKIIYFPDTLTGTSAGNYKHFKTYINTGAGKEDQNNIPVEFDYTIIKPPHLHIDLGDSVENNFFFAIRPLQYRKTTLLVDNTSYTCLLLTTKILDFGKNSSYLVVSSDTNLLHDFNENGSYHAKFFLGDVVLAGNKKYIFESIAPSGDSLTLRPLRPDSILYGAKPGFYANKFSATDILTKHSLTNNTYPGDYLLLDFWGTWCGPCLSILDDQKKLHSNIEYQKIKMIGICYDTDENAVGEFLRKNKIDWPQIFDAKNSSTFVTLFDVRSYPSFILIDPEGKIIYRDENTFGYYRLKNKLNEILSLPQNK